MKEFALIFRSDYHPETKFSPEEMQAILKKWRDWMGGIAAQNKLANSGTRLGSQGKTLKPGNVITDGPYAEIKEMISGIITVRAISLDEAVELAKGCPILEKSGNVEVRDVMIMDN